MKTAKMSQKRRQIFEDSVCTIYDCNGHYEVWAKLRGKVIEPTDEQFGLWAWSCYTKDRAFVIAGQLLSGRRKVEINWVEVEE